MKYISTRGNYEPVAAATAIRLGMVPNGGLFVPATIPQLSLKEITGFKDKSYQEVADKVLSEFLTDYTKEELQQAIQAAIIKKIFLIRQLLP